MTSTSLWTDPVYDAMDDLSKIILPYHLDGIEQLVEILSRPIVITPLDIIDALRHGWSRTPSEVVQNKLNNELALYDERHGQSNSRMRYKWRDIASYIAKNQCYEATLPTKIMYTFDEKGMICINEGSDSVLSVNISVTKEMLAEVLHSKSQDLSNALTVKSQKGVLGRLRELSDIFGSSCSKSRSLAKSIDHAERAILRSFQKSDIRSNIVFNQTVEHVYRWVNNENMASLVWLKALKARMSLGETIYSMELK